MATIFLLGFAIASLYAGGPVSALFGVFTDSIVIAYPVDLILWVVLGFTVAQFSARRGRPVLPVALVVLAVFLVYGLVLSQFVELTVSNAS